MKKTLCIFTVLLSICIFPIYLRVPIEIAHIFGLVEADIFNWYRMWLVALAGTTFLIFTLENISIWIIAYWGLAIISMCFSKYIRTCLFGSPWTHEGILALLGYIGIYQTTKKYGFFKGLEKAIDVVIVIVFLISILQIIYFKYPDFILFRHDLNGFKIDLKWPLYSTMGCSDHLGLFCALLFPYTLLRKKYVLATEILFMAVNCESRGSWLSIFLTTAFMGRITLKYVAIAALILSIPFYKNIYTKVVSSMHEIHYPIRDKDISGRAYMWKRTIPIVKRTTLVGNGSATFGLYIPQKDERAISVGFGNCIVDRPHNMYLNMWTGTGLISLIIMVFGICKILVNSNDISLEMSVIGFLIAGFFTDSVLCVTPYFVMFLGSLSHKENK